MTKRLSDMQKNNCYLTSGKSGLRRRVDFGRNDGCIWPSGNVWTCSLLYALSLKYNETNIDLSRDDELAVFRNISGPHCLKTNKEFQKLFWQHGLKSIIKCNLKMYFLDVALNLTDSTYKPDHKPNDNMCLIHLQ